MYIYLQNSKKKMENEEQQQQRSSSPPHIEMYLQDILNSETHVNAPVALAYTQEKTHIYEILALILSYYMHATQGTPKPPIENISGWNQ